MPATIWIAAPRGHGAGEPDEVAVGGATVAEALAELEREHAGLLRGLLENGRVEPLVNVFVNGLDIRFAQALQTPLGDGDEIAIVPSIAGGR